MGRGLFRGLLTSHAGGSTMLHCLSSSPACLGRFFVIVLSVVVLVVPTLLSAQNRGSGQQARPDEGRDERRRALVTEIQTVKSKQKELSRRIGNMKREGQDAETLMAEVRSMGDEVSALERLKGWFKGNF